LIFSLHIGYEQQLPPNVDFILVVSS